MRRITFFDKGGRLERKELVKQGKAPKDFFYGLIDLEERGYRIEGIQYIRSRRGLKDSLIGYLENIWGCFTGVGIQFFLSKRIRSAFKEADLRVSFTDGFSLTMGLHRKKERQDKYYLIGCFHRLSDMEQRCIWFFRPILHLVIIRSLRGLDHIGFFGKADMDYAVERYGIEPSKCSVIPFGVDTEFWTPGRGQEGAQLFSIGQDPNRDYDALINARVDTPIRLHTCLNIRIPKNENRIKKTIGSFYQSSLSDEQLRHEYRSSLAVVVPLKDVLQPSGYSVTLQAMACGKVVILTRTRGLWSPELMIDGYNCLLVPPGDSEAIASAINRVSRDRHFRERVGKHARKTIEDHFTCAKLASSLEEILAKAP